MALIVYPTEDYDSYVSVLDANLFIDMYSTHGDSWSALADATKEIYLRIAKENIDLRIDLLLLGANSGCLGKACAMMAIHDVVHTISSGVNKNEGLISKEKVGDLEVNYIHGIKSKSGIETDYYPRNVRNCLISFGAVFSYNQTTLGRA